LTKEYVGLLCFDFGALYVHRLNEERLFVFLRAAADDETQVCYRARFFGGILPHLRLRTVLQTRKTRQQLLINNHLKVERDVDQFF